MDLTIVRLNAHLNYMYPRIFDENKRKEFIKAMFLLKNDEIPTEDKYGGTKMALDIYRQIVQIHKERFEEGRSGDAYLEKL